MAAPKPVAPSAAPASADAKPDTVVAPVDVAEASAKQTPTVLPALGSKAVKDTSLPKPEERAPKPAAKVSASKPLPAAKLDLRLPPGMVEQLQPEEPVDIDFSKPALLPEMFVEKPTQPGPFELNGRLITNDHSKEDYWDSVEGAELQFKFRN
ncbi:hypothetical protein A9179_07730 [Pseudomonas alcaligenes]|uniref:Translation initiation factor 2 n=1 Tax=Aquipseudomonas alcaligenes TaxID=43263 RepID=A0ABR7RXU9_AQUAC|nr:hypothetical protein [Pseudomonas alcaligenes]